MKQFVIGDIHGNYKALKEVFKQSKLNYDEDHLIILGDICDGFTQTKQCVDELLKIKNRIFILGNHDVFFRNYIKDREKRPHGWIYQGGYATLESYKDGIPESHKDFFLYEACISYHEKIHNNLFIHGGLGKHSSPELCDVECLTWDRTMIERARKGEIIGSYDNIFIGHTATNHSPFYSSEPVMVSNVVILDQGGGWDGKLSLLDITKKDRKEWKLYSSSIQKNPSIM